MSDTHKEGKRGWRKIPYRPETTTERNAIAGRHTYGRTEKILRRCRKIWTRLLNKIRRRTDKESVERGVKEVETTHTLSVYYGNDKRWDQPMLERVQRALDRECVGFDGLQADFEFRTRDEALTALLIVRDLGVRAQTEGMGEGPSSGAVEAARDAMRTVYEQRSGQ